MLITNMIKKTKDVLINCRRKVDAPKWKKAKSIRVRLKVGNDISKQLLSPFTPYIVLHTFKFQKASKGSRAIKNSVPALDSQLVDVHVLFMFDIVKLIQNLENCGHGPRLSWTRIRTNIAILIGKFRQRTPRGLLDFHEVAR